jgi:hypothetical protein
MEQLLNRLKAEQQRYALEALSRPTAKDAFEYGYRAGTVAGIEASIDILLNLINDEKHGNNDI